MLRGAATLSSFPGLPTLCKLGKRNFCDSLDILLILSAGAACPYPREVDLDIRPYPRIASSLEPSCNPSNDYPRTAEISFLIF